MLDDERHRLRVLTPHLPSPAPGFASPERYGPGFASPERYGLTLRRLTVMA